MKSRLGLWGLLLVCASGAPVWAAAPAKNRTLAPQPLPTLVGDPWLGRDKADAERCIECHGSTGQGVQALHGGPAVLPKLAGQSSAYMLKQIRDFRSGARPHDQMQIMARSVSDADVADIAAYFAAQPAMAGTGGATQALGQALYEAVSPPNRPLACIACHGSRTQAPLAGVPVLAGQTVHYLVQQLQAWRSGQRRNSPQHTMNQVTQGLSDADIEALAQYLGGL